MHFKNADRVHLIVEKSNTKRKKKKNLLRQSFKINYMKT